MLSFGGDALGPRLSEFLKADLISEIYSLMI